MRAITLSTNPSFRRPALDFAAAAEGIDVRKVVDCGVLPVISSGIAHREAGASVKSVPASRPRQRRALRRR